ncbi:hypothetical protein LINPERPRIM_LOCUS17466 [Linum perenne]
MIGVSPDGAKVVTQTRHLHSASRKVSSRWFLPKKLLNVSLQIRIHSRKAPLRLHKLTIDAQTSEKVHVLECYGCLTVVQQKSTGLGTPSLDQCVTVTSHSIPSTFTDHYANTLYLSPGDNLSVSIVNVKLTNDNYHVWSRAFSVPLSIKNKTAFIDGLAPVPDPDDETFTAWNRCNFVVLSWILNTVSEDIAQSLISYDNAAAAWKDLK